jgi:integrase
LLAFVEFMHGTGMRVDEVRSLRVRDCKLVSEGGRPVERNGEWVMEDERFRLEISVRKSKTGPRNTIARRSVGKVFKRLVEGKRGSDLLFTEHHRDAFRELLEAAGLRKGPFGFDRNLKCLRPTALSHWLLEHPQIDLAWLSANVGTSIQMLNDFYLTPLFP